MTRSSLVVFAVAALGCGTPDAAPARAGGEPPRAEPEAEVQAPPEPADWFGIARYPSARELCSQHVSASTMHISWTAFATPDALEDVRAFYEEHRGDAEITAEEADAFSLRRPGDARHVVGVSHADGAHPTCEVAPAASDRTYFVVSTSTGAR